MCLSLGFPEGSLGVESKSSIAQRKFVYDVQELAEGQSLAEMVDDGWRCSEDEITALALQLLDILAYLSSRRPPITHRSLPIKCNSFQSDTEISNQTQSVAIENICNNITALVLRLTCPPADRRSSSCRGHSRSNIVRLRYISNNSANSLRLALGKL